MDRRRESRLLVEVFGSYQLKSSEPRTVSISQISANGCRLTGVSTTLAVGDIVQVSFVPIEPMDATVQWRTDHTAGLKFSEALDLVIVAYLQAACGNAA